ncbi:MAG TPA: glycerate kinase [Bacteroidota bacterium]|nr:glycerate kinase [Bacteroidota bacterium]
MTMPLRILIAPDSFKGTLTAAEAAAAMESGVLTALPDAVVMKQPLSDGGEGMVDIITGALGGRIITTRVSGPLPEQRVDATWGLSADGTTAVIEMAEAAGLLLVPKERRNPGITSTIGVGEVMKAALDEGVSSLLIGIGGSATNDGGAGMAEALGYKFLDAGGSPLDRGGAALMNLAIIDPAEKDPRLDRVEILVACDVQNTLCGKEGASAVYGPQKGASLSDVSLLDKALGHFGRLIQSQLNVDVLSLPGGGAAGGLGAGLVAFCGARLLNGIDLVLRITKFDERLQTVDLVITGEGKIDRQFSYGKSLAGVVGHSKKLGVPALAVVGRREGDRALFVNADAFADIESLVDEEFSEQEAMNNAAVMVAQKTNRLLQRYLSRT